MKKLQKLSFLFEFPFVVRSNRFCYVCSGTQVKFSHFSETLVPVQAQTELFSAMRLNRPATPGASAGGVLFLAFSSLVLLEGELFDCMPSGLGHLLDLACLGSRLLLGPSVPLSVQPCVKPSVKSLKS